MVIFMFCLYLLYVRLNLSFKVLTPGQKQVKLSYLSAALDPQEMAQRYWSYEGFMPIF